MPAALPLCVLLAVATAGDDPTLPVRGDWPQWRGPDRNAVSPETDLLHEWPTAGPPELWRIRVGVGFSSVSVAGDMLYTMWDEDGKQYLVCLEAETGDLVWRHRLGTGFRNNYGDGPRSTPLVDGDTVYAIGTQGTLLAAEGRTGETRWEHDLVDVFEARLPTYGYSSSPLVVGDKLLVETAGQEAAYTAFHKETGEEAWVAGGDPPAYTSPLLVEIADERQVLFWGASAVRSVSLDTGDALWSTPWSTDCPVTGDPLGCAQPIFLPPDRLFLSSGSGAAVVRVTRDEDRWQVETLWESRELRNTVNSSVALGDFVYGFDQGTLKCLDLRTGAVQWQKRGFRSGSLLAADGQLIVLGELGRLALVEATPERYVERSSANVLEGKSWTMPTLAAGRLYLRNHTEMVCIDMRAR